MDKSLRILHLEDEPDYCGLVKALLEKEGLAADIVLVRDLEGSLRLWTRVGSTSFWRITDCQLHGIEALREARQRCPGTPFVLVSGTIGEQAAIEAMKCGATDYVLKQWPERLGPAVRRAVRRREPAGAEAGRGGIEPPRRLLPSAHETHLTGLQSSAVTGDPVQQRLVETNIGIRA